MPIELMIPITLLCILAISFLYLEPIILKYRITNKNEYGSARFATKKEIKNTYSKQRISKIIEAGIPVLFSRTLKYVWFDNLTPHYVYLGSTGSGKSVTAVIPECSFIATALKKRSVFITDPKAEIFNATSKMFQDNGYKILTLDFRNPELSNHFNILETIITEYEEYIENEKKSLNSEDSESKTKYNNLMMMNYAETNKQITSLANMIMQEKAQSKDPFWNNSATNLLEGLIGFFLEEYKAGNIKREQITMTSIRKFQNSSMQDRNFAKFKLYIQNKEYGTKSKDSLTSILSANENTYKSVTAVFGEKMAIFDDINVANVTSDSDFDMASLGKEPTALFVIVPDEDRTYFTLVTIFVGLLYKALVKVANNQESKRLPVEIDWILDEFANMPPLSNIESIISVARSRGMRFHFFIQSFSQLDNIYGKEVAQTILDNCGLIYLKTNTQDTAEAISRRLGKKTIETTSISQSTSDYKGNESTSLIARDLLTADEVKQLHYKTIIFPTKGYPIFRKTIVYSRFSCYKKGKVIRKTNFLKQLDYTYYTVEQIKSNNSKSQNQSNSTEDNNQDDEANEFLEQQKNIQKNTLLKAIVLLKKILKEKDLEYTYKSVNNGIFALVNLNRQLTTFEKTLIKGQIDKKTFHIIINEESNKIEIHLESPYLLLKGELNEDF